MLYFSGFKFLKNVVPNFRQLNIIYKEGSKKIEQDLNIISIIKDLRRLKIASSLNIDDQLNFEIENTHKNLIILDTEDKNKNSHDESQILRLDIEEK